MKTWLALIAAIAWLPLAPAVGSAQSRLSLEGGVAGAGSGAQKATIEVRAGSDLLASGATRPDGSFSLIFDPRGFDEFTVLVRGAFGTRMVEIGRTRRTARVAETDLVIEVRLATPASAAPMKPPPPPPPPPQTGPGGFPDGRGTVAGAVTEGDNHAIVKVYYATDRLRAVATELDFTGARNDDGRLHLGRYDVSVPRQREMGSIERPSMWTFWREDPNRHFIIVRRALQSYEEFYNELSGLVAASRTHAAFVFVHGYNVPFESAVYRTAQLAYDLGFDGAPILYSWPSTGTEIGYPVDSNNSQWTIPHLRWFLEDVTAKTGAKVVHVIAHSMGNVPVVHALREIAIAPRSGPRPHFNQVVLTAPDIDVDTFRQLAGALNGAADRITLYASSNDVALQLSRKYQGYQRAGDSVPQVVVLPGIDTVEVSALRTDFLGHSYYGDNKSVLADLFGLIRDGLAPSARFGLRQTGSPPRQWWVFQP